MQATIDAARKDATAVAKAEAESYVAQFKDQMQRRSAIATQYERRIKELEGSNKAIKKKMKELQTRRAMDLEGFTADVTTLRKLLNAVDRRLHQTRLVQRLDDDERLDLLLEQLERRAPDPSGLNDEVAPNTNSKKPSGYVGARDAGGVAFDIQHIRSALGSVEDRLAEAKVGVGATRDDDDDDDDGRKVRIVPGDGNAAAEEYVKNRARRGQENSGPAVIVAGGAAGAPRNSARPASAKRARFDNRVVQYSRVVGRFLFLTSSHLALNAWRASIGSSKRNPSPYA